MECSRERPQEVPPDILYNMVIDVLYIFVRWALFPPQTPRDILKVPPGVGGNQRNEAISWFVHVYPKTQLPSWPREYRPVCAHIHMAI